MDQRDHQILWKMDEDQMDKGQFSVNFKGLPSGKRLHSELENHSFLWVNPLFRLGHFQ